MSMPRVLFSHGQESGPWGTKIRAMAEMVRSLGCTADSIDYQGMVDPAERVKKLVEAIGSASDPIVLVGSSMGGHVATAAADQASVVGLFVLAPAYYMPGYEDLTPAAPSVPIEIVHGWKDDIVPPENSIRFASDCHATLHMVDGDHRLTANIDEINYYLARFIDRLANARREDL
jgi:pimeloyl-ACP methyl ester carboxylesterase